MKVFRILGIVLILIIAGFFFVKQMKPTQQKPTKLIPVSLAMDWTPNTDHTGIYAAQAKGWYKEQGIDLKILPFSSDVSSTVLVISGKADIGIGSIEDVVGNAAKNNPIIAIGSVLQHNTSGFIVLSDSGITRPKELDGKIYGGYGSPFENAVVSEIIKQDGGSGDFKNVVLDVKAMQALESKRIDFVWVLEGWEVIQAKRDGFKVKFFPLTRYGIPDSPTLAFIVTPQKIKQNPAILKKFMAATAKGYEYAKTHPKESAQILINSVQKGTFPDPGLVFDSQVYLSSQYADKGRKWGLQDKKAWHDYPQFMLDSGSITDTAEKPVKTMDFDTLYTNEFIQ